MFFIEDSLTVVLVGDWNMLYMQPDWMAQHVYEKDEIEIGVDGQGAGFNISYRCDNVIIKPLQNKVTFAATKADELTLESLAKCVNNFLERAFTPSVRAYGINGKFGDEDGSVFAEVLDSMSDSSLIVNCGYEIKTTKVKRTLLKDGKIINMDSSLENAELKVNFNEHHSNIEELPQFSFSLLNGFIQECSKILEGLGYELESDE